VERTGDSVGVRHGGLLDFVTREIQIEVLPRELPEKIEVDISDLDLEQHVTVGDLASLLPKSARLLDDPNRVVVTIEAPRGAKVEGEGEEGEEAGPSLVITEQAEPEVIRKGKAEETGESE
jgi:large subunit ribosomal protein L25